MTKILQVVAHLMQNGTEAFIMNLFRNINHQDFHFDFLIFSDSKDGYYNEIIASGSNIFSLPPRKKGIINYYRQLDNFFSTKAKDYDAIHLHVSSFSSIAPLLYAKKYGIKKRIFHSHSSNCIGLHNKIFHYFNKFYVKSIGTHFLACSEQAKKWAYGGLSIFPKAQIIANGIDIDIFSYKKNIRKIERDRLSLGHSLVIGHVGTFNPIKNHIFLLSIFKEVIRLHPDSVLLLIGDGPLMEEMKQKAIDFNISNKVIFIGKRTDVYNLMQAIDIFVMPSLYEGLPFSLIEAQTANLPVIASEGISKEVKISNNFKFLPLGNSRQWAEEILNFKNFDRNDYSHVFLNKYSINTTVTQMTDIYNNK